MTHSNAVMLDSVSNGLKPIVRVIDDWVTNRSPGLIFGCRVGNGKLLVSSIDLVYEQSARPEARQWLFSLKKYMETVHFNPQTSVEIIQIERLTD